MSDNNWKTINGKIVNTETGEIIELENPIYELKEGDVVHSKNQIEAYKKVNERNKIQREMVESFGNFLFVKVKSEMVSFINKKIPEQYIPRIFVLGTYADKNGLIVKDGIPMMQKDIIDILNITRPTFINMAKELEKKKIMHKVDGKYYKLSKTYLVRGQLPNKISNKTRYIKVFVDTVREIYNNLNISKTTHYKAFVMAVHLIPLLEKDTCIPKHMNGNNVTVRELLQMVGISDEKYWRQINYIKHLKLNNGEQLIKFLTSSFDKESALNASMIVNPKVFYGGDVENMLDIECSFNEIPNN